MEALPDERLVEMRRSLRRKLPKLEEHRRPDGRTMLVFENQDIQLVNAFIVVDAISAALQLETDLPAPDVIVMANVFGEAEALTWLKDGDVWHPDFDGLYWVELPKR
jgi:hypothetical protein